MRNVLGLTSTLFFCFLASVLSAQDHLPKLNMNGKSALVNLPADFPACLAKEKIDTAKMTDLEKQLLSHLQNGKAVPFNLVTDAWIDLYLREYNADHKSKYSLPFAKGRLTAIANGTDKSDVFQFKSDVESRLQLLHPKSALVYNTDYSNPLDMLFQNKMQCRSGTICYSLAARLAWGSEVYSKRSPIMIMTKGHVLPGFILEDEKGVKRLEGVESTGKGYARKSFGPLSELDKSKEAVRIIDAESFAALDILSPHLSEEALKCAQNTLQQNLYKTVGLDLAKLEENVKAADAKGGVIPKGKHASPWAFGIPDVKKGDQPRADFGPNPYAPKDKGIKGPIYLPTPPLRIDGQWKDLRVKRIQLHDVLNSKVANRILYDAEDMVFKNPKTLEPGNAEYAKRLGSVEKEHQTALRNYLSDVAKTFPPTAVEEFREFRYWTQRDSEARYFGPRSTPYYEDFDAEYFKDKSIPKK